MPKLYLVRVSGPCRAVWMFCVKHCIDVELVDVDLAGQQQLGAAFVSKSPTKSVPVWEEEDGFTLWEHHAILRYLADKHKSPLYPASLRERMQVLELMDWQQRELQPALQSAVFPRLWDFFRLPDPAATKELVKFGEQQLSKWQAVGGPSCT